MLFDSSFRKELTRSFGATLVVLITIVITVMLIRTLGRASIGRVDPSEIMLVMGLAVVGYLPVILTLSLFVAVTATLTRMYANSEMVIWFSSGQGLFAFVRPLLQFAWPYVLLVALLSLVAWPWANQQGRELRERYQDRGDIERVTPGQFIESAGDKRVFFIDKDSETTESANHIFIATDEDGVQTVISAQNGKIVQRNNGQHLQLLNGIRVETTAATGEMRISEFAEYENLITTQTILRGPDERPRFKTTTALLAHPDPGNMGEFSWRLGVALLGLNCLLIGLAATRVNPRVGRSAGLIFSLLAFATYYNLLSMGQNWIGRGRMNVWVFMLVLHGGIFLAAIGWLWWRQRQWRRPDTPQDTAIAS